MPSVLPTLDCPLKLIRAQGFSMEPSLLDGDELIVQADVPFQAYFPGHLALYQNDRYEFPVAHRVVKMDIKNNRVLFQSDAFPSNREWISSECLKGRVVMARRSGRIIYDGNAKWASLMDRWNVVTSLHRFRVQQILAQWIGMILQPFQQTSFYKAIFLKNVQIDVQSLKMREHFYRFTAKVNGHYAGHVDLEICDRLGKRVGLISGLGVRIRYRGVGIGRKLILAASCGVEDEIREIWAEVDKKNHQALCFYHKLEFEIISEASHGMASSQFCVLRKALCD